MLTYQINGLEMGQILQANELCSIIVYQNIPFECETNYVQTS